MKRRGEQVDVKAILREAEGVRNLSGVEIGKGEGEHPAGWEEQGEVVVRRERRGSEQNLKKAKGWEEGCRCSNTSRTHSITVDVCCES
jgi:hypothetical protein